MKNILIIAKNTFRLVFREWSVYAILCFALIYIFLTLFVGVLTLNDVAMVRSVGLAGMYVFGVIITIFLSSTVFYKEIEQRTLYFIIPKPISRGEIILGKFIGLFSAIFLSVVIMTLAYFGVVAYEGGGVDYMGLLAIFFQLLEIAIFISMGFFFSIFLNSFVSILCSVMLFFIGHLLSPLVEDLSGRGISGAANFLIKAMYYIFPNLEKFNIRNIVIHEVSISFNVIFFTTCYALAYSIIFLYGTYLIFKKKDF